MHPGRLGTCPHGDYPLCSRYMICVSHLAVRTAWNRLDNRIYTHHVVFEESTVLLLSPSRTQMLVYLFLPFLDLPATTVPTAAGVPGLLPFSSPNPPCVAPPPPPP